MTLWNRNTSPSLAWHFNFGTGNQVNITKPNDLFAWAVRPGDVSAAVPEPATATLLGLGLLALLGSARRKR